MRKTLSGVLAAAVLAVFLIPALAAGMGGRAAAAEGAPAVTYSAAVTEASSPDASSGNGTETDTVKPPASGKGWVKANDTWYYFKNGKIMKNYWVLDDSAHDLWYHMGADGTLDTGFMYVTDPVQPDGWFMFQTTDYNGMRGAMLTGWQQTGTAGSGWFNSAHNGHYGEATYTDAWGSYNRSTGRWADGLSHR